MRLGFRHADSRYPFLWEDDSQPAARWHDDGSGPTQYLSETPDGAWAEFLGHEGITDPDDLRGVERNLWAVELPEAIDSAEVVTIPEATGGLKSYPACQTYAAQQRVAGVRALCVPSAALASGGARGQVTDGGLHEASPIDGRGWVLFGTYPNLRGWCAVTSGAPPPRVLDLVRPLT
jgi:hypothetical protein